MRLTETLWDPDSESWAVLIDGEVLAHDFPDQPAADRCALDLERTYWADLVFKKAEHGTLF